MPIVQQFCNPAGLGRRNVPETAAWRIREQACLPSPAPFPRDWSSAGSLTPSSRLWFAWSMRLLLISSPGASGVKLRPGPSPPASQELQHPRGGQRLPHLLTCSGRRKGRHPLASAQLPTGDHPDPLPSCTQALVPSSFLLLFSFLTKATAQGPSARLFPAERRGARKNGVPLDRILDTGVGTQQRPNSSFPQT